MIGTMDKTKKANLCGFGSVAIWSLTSPILALTGNVPPFLVGAFCFLLAFFIMLGWWYYNHEDIVEKFRMSRETYALGTFGIFLYNAVYIYAFKTGPAMEVNLLNYTWPAFLIVLAFILQKKRPDAFALLGCVLCFAGTYFIFKSRGFTGFSGNFLTLALGLLCGVMWGAYSALSRYAKMKSSDQMAVFFLIAGVSLLVMHLVTEETVWPSGGLAWTMLLIYALCRGAFFLWDYAMRFGQTRVVASAANFIPLFSTLSLMAVGYTNFNRLMIAGAILIIAGCIVINLPTIIRTYFSVPPKGKTSA